MVGAQDSPDEIPSAHKEVDTMMQDAADLVEIRHTLRRGRYRFRSGMASGINWCRPGDTN